MADGNLAISSEKEKFIMQETVVQITSGQEVFDQLADVDFRNQWINL